MKAKFNLLMLLLTVSFMWSCNEVHTDPEAYIQAVEEKEGLVKTKHFGEFSMEVQYTPHAYVVLQSLPKCDKNTFEKEVNKLGELTYFTMKVKGLGAGIAPGNSNPTQLGQYFDYRFERDVKLKAGDKEVAPLLYHFVHGNDLTNEKTFLFAFDKQEVDNFVFSVDSPVMAFGELNFDIDLGDEPTYKPS